MWGLMGWNRFENQGASDSTAEMGPRCDGAEVDSKARTDEGYPGTITGN